MIAKTYGYDGFTDQANGYVIADAVMLVPEGAPTSTATWQATLPAAGNWRVSARWPAHPNRATNAVFRVQTPSGIVPVTVNQQANGGAWTTLGTWAFNAGATTITVNDQADGYVIADAVRYEPEGALPESANWSPALTTPARYDVYARWTALANRTAQAKYVITHQGGTAIVTQNQQANGGTWNLLGTWTFAPGHGVRLEAADDGYAIADAVRFTPAAEQPTLGGLHYVHPDHLGTPCAITRPSDNALVWRWENAEPFGDSQPNENPTGLGAFAYNLRFPGQYFDTETGTHYNYFRDFDPSIGRYIQSDPIGLSGGINTFAYVSGRPLSSTDPFGLDETFWSPGKGRGFGDGPRNGNWCGGNWSGGRAPSLNGGKDGSAPPLDSLDSCCKVHDDCFATCDRLPKPLQESCYNTCNKGLIGCLQGLGDDCTTWPKPPRKGTESDSQNYRADAIRVFTQKVQESERRQRQAR